MAEYIERERAKKILSFGVGASAAAALDKCPTADVVEVVHGRWIPFHSQVAGYIQYCSACEIGCTWQPNYCPNCGARMDGE